MSPGAGDPPPGPLDFEDDDDAGRRPRDAPQSATTPPRAPDPPRSPRRYGWFLAFAAAALIVLVTLNTLSNTGPGSTGVPIGTPVPEFAAPIAAGPLQGDVNVATRARQGAAGSVPACSLHGPAVLTSCALTRGAPAVLAFFVTASSRCAGQLDALEQVRRNTPGVHVAAVAIRGDRGTAARLAGQHGWRFPVAYDRDGVLANLYGVAVCPHITYVLPGGRVDGTTVGSLSAVALQARVDALLRHARALGWKPSP